MPTALTALTVLVSSSVALGLLASWLVRRHPRSAQAGQATAEYALVMLGAAAIALLLAAWAAKSGAIGRLFDAVVDQLVDKAG